MASEREKEKNLRRALAEVGIRGPLLDKAVQAILGTAPVEKPQPEKRRCGASLPYESADDGWHWCTLPAGHATPHTDGLDIWWRDGDAVEVTTVDEVWAVPDHRHDFTGDHDTCVREQGCELTWGEFKQQDREWGMDHD